MQIRANRILTELLAGLSGALIGAPQAMAFALIAGINPIYGLYTAIVATLIGALFDGHGVMTIAPTNALALVVGSALGTFADGSGGELERLFALTALVGVFQLGFGFLRLGRLMRYFDAAVMTGFIGGAGLLIVLNQLPTLTGLALSGGKYALTQRGMVTAGGGFRAANDGAGRFGAGLDAGFLAYAGAPLRDAGGSGGGVPGGGRAGLAGGGAGARYRHAAAAPAGLRLAGLGLLAGARAGGAGDCRVGLGAIGGVGARLAGGPGEVCEEARLEFTGFPGAGVGESGGRRLAVHAGGRVAFADGAAAGGRRADALEQRGFGAGTGRFAVERGQPSGADRAAGAGRAVGCRWLETDQLEVDPALLG